MKIFLQAGNLNIHERTHTGGKPFNCTNFDKSFSVSSNLKTHYRIHSGGKPFYCTKQSVTKFFQYQVFWDERTHTREAFQMLDVWQELLRIRPLFKDSWEDPHRRNAIPILQVYEDILSSRQLEETWEDPHRSLSKVQSVTIQELLEIRPCQETWVKPHCKESI